MDSRVFDSASKLTADIELALPDAVILAAVLVDASGRPAQSIFLDRNTNDLDNPDVKARLRQVSCDPIGGFQAASCIRLRRPPEMLR